MENMDVSFPGLGLSFSVNRVAFSIGSFNVYWYGIIIGAGFLLALLFAMKSLRRFGISSDSFFDCVLVGLVAGIIGARLYYVFFRWDYYSANPGEIMSVHSGGLAIYGGIIGGLGAACIMAKFRRINIPAMLDIGGMGFLIGQGIGRWGNFVNQEAFGTPTELPWRMVSENTGNIGVHPCFLYESVWCLAGFFVLLLLSYKWRKFDGQMFLLYLMWYGLERMLVEGLRTDSLYTPFFGLRVSQILSAVLVAVGIVLLVVGLKKAPAPRGLVPAADAPADKEEPEKKDGAKAEKKEGAEENKKEPEKTGNAENKPETGDRINDKEK